MKKNVTFLIFSFLFQSVYCQQSLMVGETELILDTIVSEVDIPWEIKFYDSNIWFTERIGRVSKVDVNTKEKKVLLNLTNIVTQTSESGMLGMVLHPNFESTPEVFLAYTYTSNGVMLERIVKFTFQNDTLIDEVILIDNIPANSTHNGCRLLILPDNTLLATTGDAQNLSAPQNFNHLNGKILRMNLDGTIPLDNPADTSYTYVFGMRNVQGLAMLPNGSVMMSEHGTFQDDEVQLAHAGRNYGWPELEGFCETPQEILFCNENNVVEPIVAYTPTIAPSDLIYYSNPNFPEWHNRVLMTVLKDKEIRALKFNEDFTVLESDSVYLKNQFGRLRDIEIGSENEIYIATNGQSWANTNPNTHAIIRLTPKTSNDSLGVSISNVETKTFAIYPNPSNNVVNIEVLSDTHPFNLNVYNAIGSKVFTENNIYEINYKLDVSKFSNGIYFFEITTKTEQKQLQKVLISK